MNAVIEHRERMAHFATLVALGWAVVEAALVLLPVCSTAAVICWLAVSRGDLLAALVATLVALLRALAIPSSRARTAIMTALAFVPVLIVANRIEEHLLPHVLWAFMILSIAAYGIHTEPTTSPRRDELDLRDLVRRHGPLPPSRVVHILEQLCALLAEANDLGLVHRGLEPANVRLGCQGGVPDVVRLGPEVITIRNDVGPSSDVHGLGAIAYYLLTGRSETSLPPVAFADISDSFDELILRCLDRAPAARPASARELARMLRGCAPPWSAKDATGWWNEPRPPKR